LEEHVVNPFQPRFCRYEVNLPIRFFSSDGLATGQILNVSDSGMLVQFDTPVSIWTMGELTTRVGDRNINIKARTARVEGRKVGLNFMEGTHNNSDILHLIDFAVEQSQKRSQSVAS
jgi:PilZ domain